MTTLRTLQQLAKNPAPITPLFKASTPLSIPVLELEKSVVKPEESFPFELLDELPLKGNVQPRGKYRSIDYRRTHVDPLGPATFSYIEPTIQSVRNKCWYITPSQYVEYFVSNFGTIKLRSAHSEFNPVLNSNHAADLLAYETAWKAYLYWKKSLKTPCSTPITHLSVTTKQTYADHIRHAENIDQSFYDEKTRGISDWTLNQRQTRQAICKRLTDVVSSNQLKINKTLAAFYIEHPSMPFQEYFERIVKYNSYEIMIFALIYIHIVLKSLQDTYHAMNAHLLLVAAVNIAKKMHECQEFDQKKQAVLYGISVTRLNLIESKMFFLLDNNAHITREKFLECEQIILAEILNQEKALASGSREIVMGPKKAFLFPDNLQTIEKVEDHLTPAFKLPTPSK